jgi:hypothetical protein
MLPDSNFQLSREKKNKFSFQIFIFFISKKNLRPQFGREFHKSFQIFHLTFSDHQESTPEHTPHQHAAPRRRFAQALPRRAHEQRASCRAVCPEEECLTMPPGTAEPQLAN